MPFEMHDNIELIKDKLVSEGVTWEWTKAIEV